MDNFRPPIPIYLFFDKTSYVAQAEQTHTGVRKILNLILYRSMSVKVWFKEPQSNSLVVLR